MKSFASSYALCGFALIFSMSGCTYLGLEEPQIDMTTTQMAMATGGAIGAGLGAIVGSQTGDPGVGLVLGAAAGAGSGALIGNALENQEGTLRTQEEAIRRQGQTIATQRQELDALRQLDRDAPLQRRPSSPGFSTPALKSSSDSFSTGPRARFQGSTEASRSGRESTLSQSDSRQNQAFDDRSQELRNRPLQKQMIEELHAYDDRAYDEGRVNEAGVAAGDSARAGLRVEEQPQGGFSMADSSGCAAAAQEVEDAGRVQDPSDKLFHFRRALRLCPSKADFHAGLAETYRALGRNEDAAYEFREALNVDPSFRPALDGLDSLENQR